jgi:hypothetical protein
VINVSSPLLLYFPYDYKKFLCLFREKILEKGALEKIQVNPLGVLILPRK